MYYLRYKLETFGIFINDTGEEKQLIKHLETGTNICFVKSELKNGLKDFIDYLDQEKWKKDNFETNIVKELEKMRVNYIKNKKTLILDNVIMQGSI